MPEKCFNAAAVMRRGTRATAADRRVFVDFCTFFDWFTGLLLQTYTANHASQLHQRT